MSAQRSFVYAGHARTASDESHRSLISISGFEFGDNLVQHLVTREMGRHAYSFGRVGCGCARIGLRQSGDRAFAVVPGPLFLHP